MYMVGVVRPGAVGPDRLPGGSVHQQLPASATLNTKRLAIHTNDLNHVILCHVKKIVFHIVFPGAVAANCVFGAACLPAAATLNTNVRTPHTNKKL